MFNALRPLLLLTAFAAVAPAHAQDSEPAPDARSQRQSAEDRVREVERDGGRVLQAEPMQRGGQEVYRLKVLTPEGRVRVIHDGRESRSERGSDRMDSSRPGRVSRDRDREPDREPESRRTESSSDPGGRPVPRAEGGRSGGRDDRY